MHVLAPAPAGGLERVVHALAIGQCRRGHDVVAVPIVEKWVPDHAFAIPLSRENVEIVPVSVPRRGYVRERSILAELFRSRLPDLVHTHNYHADVIAGPVARRAHIATVSTAHGFTGGPWRNRVYEQLARVAFRSFDAVIAVSQPLALDLRRSGVSESHIHIVPNAWSRVSTPLNRADARRELGLESEPFVVGWVGRMSYEKGLDLFLDALIRLTDMPISACAIGDGAERAAQRIRASSAGLEGRVRWPGLVQEAGRLFQAFDVLVLSSRTEGVPMVMLEAMALGVPLVVTAVGGIPDVVSGNEAIIVPSDDPAALADGIRSAFHDRDGAAARAAAALRRVNCDFGERRWLERYEEVYRAALNGATRRYRKC